MILSAEERKEALRELSSHAGYGYIGIGNGYCKCAAHRLAYHMNACEKALREAEAQIQKLETALRIFARCADMYTDLIDDSPIVTLVGSAAIRVGDLRKARQALAQPAAPEAGKAKTPCNHEHLDMDGICHTCGADKRGIG
jgi:hypothetical protein